MNGSISLDLDGCVADFELAFCQRFGWENRSKFKLENRYPECEEDILDFVANPGTYKNLDIVELGYKIANFCIRERYNIYIVSSRPRYVMSETREWLEANKLYWNSLSLHENHKLTRINCVPDLKFVIEDDLKVAKKLADVDIPVFLIDQPWNQSDEPLSGIIYRTKSFDQFLANYTDFFDDF